MSKRTRILLLIGVLIIATFFRFYHFTSTPPGLYPDEAIDGNNAAEVAQTDHPQVFYVEDNGREGLYINLIAGILKVFPVHEAWVIRLPAAIAGVLTVLGLYLLAAELFSVEVGLLAAFLLATSLWHINFSRIGFRAILAPLLLTWALYLLIKAFKSAQSAKSARKKWDKMRAWWYAILAGAVYALGFYTYIAYRVTPLLLLLFIPFFKKYPDFWKHAAIFVVAALLVVAPIGWYFVQHPGDFFGRTSQISIASSANPATILAANIWKTALMFNVHGDDNWRHNLSGAPELSGPVGVVFLVGIVWGIYWLAHRFRRQLRLKNSKKQIDNPDNRFSLLLFFSWFILAALPVVFSNEGIPHALRSILMLPPAIVFAALGGVLFFRWLQRYWGKRAAFVLGTIFLAVTAISTYTDYFVVWAQNPNVAGSFNTDYVTIGHEINALPAVTPKYVVVEAGGVLIRGIPTPAETTMFTTDSFTAANQAAKNIYYLLPDQMSAIPANTPSTTIFYIR